MPPTQGHKCSVNILNESFLHDKLISLILDNDLNIDFPVLSTSLKYWSDIPAAKLKEELELSSYGCRRALQIYMVANISAENIAHAHRILQIMVSVQSLITVSCLFVSSSLPLQIHYSALTTSQLQGKGW